MKINFFRYSTEWNIGIWQANFNGFNALKHAVDRGHFAVASILEHGLNGLNGSIRI